MSSALADLFDGAPEIHERDWTSMNLVGGLLLSLFTLTYACFKLRESYQQAALLAERKAKRA
jgi:hypothetical protein